MKNQNPFITYLSFFIFLFLFLVFVFSFLSTRGSKRGCVHSSQCDYALVSSPEIDTDSLEMHILCELSLYIAKALPQIRCCFNTCGLYCRAFSRWTLPSKPSINLTTHHCFSLNIVVWGRYACISMFFIIIFIRINILYPYILSKMGYISQTFPGIRIHSE